MAESESRERLLLRFADQAEDAAAGFHRFREDLPRSSATKVAAVVSELFAISSVLRRLHDDEGSRHHGPSFWRIQDDLVLLFKTFELTLDEVFAMFGRGQEGRAQTIWEDLHHQMEREEGCALQDRLELYHDFLKAQVTVLGGRGTETSQELRQDLRDLLDGQQRLQYRRRRNSVSAAPTPRPRILSRPPMHRLDTPSTPTIISDEWDNYTNADRPAPIPVPDPPPLSPLSPLSPTFTSSSSLSMPSSRTSYSSDPYFAAPPNSLIHWAQNVFDGSHALTRYSGSAQLHDRSACFGPLDPSSLANLGRDEFQRVLELPFDEEHLWVRLYWRPSDHRARILIMTRDHRGQMLLYCTPLTNLKVIRNGSCLQLCRARADGQYVLWARLNFLFHERMVLFYSTLVAMKRQDSKGIHRRLVDQTELEESDEQGEQELFAGEVKHGEMLHALRLFRDRGSGVVRMEASPLRGPKRDVPIWTAFVTKYAYDPDWAQLEGNGVVSFAAIRPSPKVFIAQYTPPQNRLRNYVLPFTTDEGSYSALNNPCK